MKLRKIEAGLYETPDGARVVQTVHDGPRGGRYYLWEYMELDAWHEWVITNTATGFPTPTLRKARQWLAEA